MPDDWTTTTGIQVNIPANMEEVDPSDQKDGRGPSPTPVKPGEVDKAGADISTVSTTEDREPNAGGDATRMRFGKMQNLREEKAAASTIRPPARPQLLRENSAPPPPQQPPPPAPLQLQQDEVGNVTDSLSLMQLKKLVTDMPKVEPTAYAFEYTDTQSFAEELEEWFQYTEKDRIMVLQGRTTFKASWADFLKETSPSEEGLTWPLAITDQRRSFITRQISGVEEADLFKRLACLEVIVYIALGSWNDTAGQRDADDSSNKAEAEGDGVGACPDLSSLQIRWMQKGAEMILDCAGLQPIFNVFKRICDRERDRDPPDNYAQMEAYERAQIEEAKEKEISNTFTLMYLLVENGREQLKRAESPTIRDGIAALQPDLLFLLAHLIANLRWDDTTNLPLPRVLLLFWKSVLLLFGGTKELGEVKLALRDKPDRSSNENDQIFITASPLDYHLFRQEITSKYPAYNPPPPLVPLELENNSILPPLPSHSSRNIGPNGSILGSGPAALNGSGASILHQPVHIATPAPSPPPSPSGPGGKAGKKQNYQTNQNFPFLYPPLDGTSNSVGGKGSAGLQDILVGKRWEGSDVPASILEAGKLFASRMRMTRGMKQLWQERERFIKYERGWVELERNKVDLEPDEDADREADAEPLDEDSDEKRFKRLDPDIKRRLNAVENFYRHAMPELQSIVIVLLKVVLANVTALVTQNNGNGQTGATFGFTGQEDNNGQGKAKINMAPSRQLNGKANGHDADGDGDVTLDPSVEELNALRLREISSQAVSGILLLLLKWFKISHILKYEYLTQLLLDSNYLPLILKFFAHQDIDKSIDHKIDRDDLSFFTLCHNHSRHPPTKPSPIDSSSSEDEAVPPPITKHRRSPPPSPASSPQPTTTTTTTSSSDTNIRPEVDELGYPTTTLPSEPITTFSHRNFSAAITYLRIMQKITKHKAHRSLLLVQYKSSTILRKALKVPEPHLRLYTLKLFKSQVPYCGRKWRQSNMRVITAIYLHCRPELRDDWLAGSDVDAEVEEALPLEQALRGLTYWWHLRCFPDRMGKEMGVLEQERDFFVRELEGMGWGVGAGITGPGAGAGAGAGAADGEGGFALGHGLGQGLGLGQDDGLGGGPNGGGGGGGGSGSGSEWDGPLQMEGW